MDKSNTKILFMGTPDFSSEILKRLIEENYNVVGVVTQPDKKVGRKQQIKFSPTKDIAIENGIPTYQPIKIKEEVDFIEQVDPDLIITAAYGQIIPDKILNYPKLGSINVHGSLLPKYRGGAPLQYALMNGDSKTGITIMEMMSKMDAGDMINRSEVEIDVDMTFGELYPKMLDAAKALLIDTLPDIIKGNYKKEKQNDSLVTFSPIISKEDEKIDWEEDAVKIHNKIRALDPVPGAFTLLDKKRVKLFSSSLKRNDENSHIIGEILNITNEGLEIQCKGRYNILIKEFQIEGKKRNTIKNIINSKSKIFSIGNKFEN